MKRIEDKNFNAFETAFAVSNDGRIRRGQFVSTSRTGLSGRLRFFIAGDERIVPAYRNDSLPARLPAELFVFRGGHGSTADPPLILFERKSQFVWDARVIWYLDSTLSSPADGDSDTYTRHLPWWVDCGTTWSLSGAPWSLRDCYFRGYTGDREVLSSVAWATWREQVAENGILRGAEHLLDAPSSVECGIACRHGLPIASGVFDIQEDRAPFTVLVPGKWICEPPTTNRRDGRLIHISGESWFIENWDETASQWAECLALGADPEGLACWVAQSNGLPEVPHE
jgi:hypothetical protein